MVKVDKFSYVYVSILANLPGHSIATTNTYMMKLEHFDEIKCRTRARSNFENEYLEMVSQLLEEIIIY